VIQSEKQGEFEILKTSGIQLDKGDRIIAVAGGGGGYGDPLERDPENVREDVDNGFVSIEHAKQDYGVVIDPDTLKVDVDATTKLRSELRNQAKQKS
jgi:N-methylhydantoinase B